MTTAAADPALAELVASLSGAWPETAGADTGRQPRHDPLGAVASIVERAVEPGPLSGQRLAIKDNIAVSGVATALGSGETGFVGDRDACVVTRALRAGARPIAKAQCEAFLLGANSFSSRPSPVRNPYDPARSAGGSSSGSAAMVAAGLADLALGTDSAGSIRIPAAHCGIVGFAPTRGRVPYTGIAPLEPFLERVGPMARDVAGAHALFAAIDGTDSVDPRTAWCPLRDEERSVPEVGSLRLGIYEDGIVLASPEVAAAVRAAVARLEAAGARCTVSAWSAFDEAQQLHLAIYLIGDALSGANALPGVAATLPPEWAGWRATVATPPLVDAMHSAGRSLHASDPGLYGRAVARALALGASLDAAFGDCDALILPTAVDVAAPIPDAGTPEQIFGDTRLTAPFNVTGHPAVSLPCGMAAGLPVGLQLVGKRGHDFALLGIAAAVAAVVGPFPAPHGDFGCL